MKGQCYCCRGTSVTSSRIAQNRCSVLERALAHQPLRLIGSKLWNEEVISEGFCAVMGLFLYVEFAESSLRVSRQCNL